MSRQSCIRHPAEGRYVKRREDYVGICEGNTCAAELLDLFEYWTNCKLERVREIQAFNETATRLQQPTLNLPTLWLYERIQDLKAALIEGFAETSIKKSLKLLKDKGFLEDKPSPTKFDNTRLYLFCISEVQLAVDNWHKAVTTESPEKSDQTETSDDQTETTLDGTKTSLDETNITLDGTKTSHISNTHSSLLSQNQKTPPTPSEEEEAGELKTEKEEESGVSTNPPILDQQNQPIDSANDKPYPEDKYSAPSPRDNTTVDTQGGAYRMEQKFRQPKYPAYRTGKGANGIKAEFLEYLRVKHLPTVSHYQGRQIEAIDAKTWVFNKESAGQQELVEARYEQMLADAIPKPSAILQVSYEPLPEKKCWLPPADEREAFKKKLLAKKAGLK